MKKLKLVILIGLLLSLFSCSGFATGRTFRVDENVDFGKKKYDGIVGIEYIFPYIGVNSSKKDSEFECEGVTCTFLRTNFGMFQFFLVGITPVPFIPFWISGDEQRTISMLCISDTNISYDIPNAILETPSMRLESMGKVLSAKEKKDSIEKYIQYNFEIKHMDFDKFFIELDGICKNIRIPYIRKRSVQYIPIMFIVND